jgi:tubulin-specific chaperone D
MKGQKPVGHAVRDAACYLLYSVVRSNPPSDLRSHLLPVATTLVCVAVFDPNSTIRRAASAAFQELVGRQGHTGNVPSGIAVLGMMDYHAVGSRRGGLEVAVRVAEVEGDYRVRMVEWCVVRGVGHWEERGREGVAMVLGRIVPMDRGYTAVLERLVGVFCDGAELDWVFGRVGCVEDSREFTCYFGDYFDGI